MRMLLNVRIPHEEFNKAVKDGSMGNKLRRILEDIKPEAVYFSEQNGQRGAIPIEGAPLTLGLRGSYYPHISSLGWS